MARGGRIQRFAKLEIGFFHRQGGVAADLSEDDPVDLVGRDRDFGGAAGRAVVHAGMIIGLDDAYFVARFKRGAQGGDERAAGFNARDLAGAVVAAIVIGGALHGVRVAHRAGRAGGLSEIVVISVGALAEDAVDLKAVNRVIMTGGVIADVAHANMLEFGGSAARLAGLAAAAAAGAIASIITDLAEFAIEIGAWARGIILVAMTHDRGGGNIDIIFIGQPAYELPGGFQRSLAGLNGGDRLIRSMELPQEADADIAGIAVGDMRAHTVHRVTRIDITFLVDHKVVADIGPAVAVHMHILNQASGGLSVARVIRGHGMMNGDAVRGVRGAVRARRAGAPLGSRNDRRAAGACATTAVFAGVTFVRSHAAAAAQIRVGVGVHAGAAQFVHAHIIAVPETQDALGLPAFSGKTCRAVLAHRAAVGRASNPAQRASLHAGAGAALIIGDIFLGAGVVASVAGIGIHVGGACDIKGHEDLAIMRQDHARGFAHSSARVGRRGAATIISLVAGGRRQRATLHVDDVFGVAARGDRLGLQRLKRRSGVLAGDDLSQVFFLDV